MHNINKLTDAIIQKKHHNPNVELIIYMDDRFYVQLRYEIHSHMGPRLPVIDTHKQTFMGYKYYRVSPNDNHPEFRIFTDVE